MTTTAAAWRHVSENQGHCIAGVLTLSVDGVMGQGTYCGCTTPTPDPASPCAVCGRSSGREHSSYCPHQPTRCVCGHALEAVR